MSQPIRTRVAPSSPTGHSGLLPAPRPGTPGCSALADRALRVAQRSPTGHSRLLSAPRPGTAGCGLACASEHHGRADRDTVVVLVAAPAASHEEPAVVMIAVRDLDPLVSTEETHCPALVHDRSPPLAHSRPLPRLEPLRASRQWPDRAGPGSCRLPPTGHLGLPDVRREGTPGCPNDAAATRSARSASQEQPGVPGRRACFLECARRSAPWLRRAPRGVPGG